MSLNPSVLNFGMTFRSLARSPAVMLTVAFLALSQESLSAATITQTWINPVLIDTPLEEFNNFQLFDSTQGTLNSIVITLNGDVSTTLTVTNNNTTNPIDVSGLVDVAYTLHNESFGSPDVSFHLTPAAIPVHVGASATVSTGPHLFSGSATTSLTDSTNLGLFSTIGFGTFQYKLFSDELSNTVGPGSYSFGYMTQGNWNIQVDYNYTSFSAVPEPSSFALLGLGCIVLPLYRRVAQRRIKQPAE